MTRTAFLKGMMVRLVEYFVILITVMYALNQKCSKTCLHFVMFVMSLAVVCDGHSWPLLALGSHKAVLHPNENWQRGLNILQQCLKPEHILSDSDMFLTVNLAFLYLSYKLRSYILSNDNLTLIEVICMSLNYFVSSFIVLCW